MTYSPSRQPKGIPVGGQFAATAHGESGLSLLPPATPTGDGLDAETVIASAARIIGPGIVPELERQFGEAKTAGGRQLLLQSVDSRYNRDSVYERVDSMAGLDAKRADQLTELGYTNVGQFSHTKLRNLNGISSVVRHGIEPDRLAFIGKLNRGEYHWSRWEKEIILTAPVADLENLIVSNKGKSHEEKYIATVALLGPTKEARARQAIAAGIRPGETGLIEAERHAPETLIALRDELPETKRSAAYIVELADRGITGEHLKQYGAKACEAFSGAELDAAEIKPAVLRSLVSSSIQTDLASYRKLHEAGYTKSADLKAASDAMRTVDIKTLAAVRKYADGRTLQAFAAKLGTSLSKADARAIGRLGKAGITEPAQLRPWTAAAHNEANRFIERGTALGLHADIVAARITPERLGEMTRAGIPVNEAPGLKNAPDLWAAGKPFRERWEADQERKFQQRWIREAQPWAFTEDTYRDGAAQ